MVAYTDIKEDEVAVKAGIALGYARHGEMTGKYEKQKFIFDLSFPGAQKAYEEIVKGNSPDKMDKCPIGVEKITTRKAETLAGNSDAGVVFFAKHSVKDGITEAHEVNLPDGQKTEERTYFKTIKEAGLLRQAITGAETKQTVATVVFDEKTKKLTSLQFGYDFTDTKTRAREVPKYNETNNLLLNREAGKDFKPKKYGEFNLSTYVNVTSAQFEKMKDAGTEIFLKSAKDAKLSEKQTKLVEKLSSEIKAKTPGQAAVMISNFVKDNGINGVSFIYRLAENTLGKEIQINSENCTTYYKDEMDSIGKNNQKVIKEFDKQSIKPTNELKTEINKDINVKEGKLNAPAKELDTTYKNIMDTSHKTVKNITESFNKIEKEVNRLDCLSKLLDKDPFLNDEQKTEIRAKINSMVTNLKTLQTKMNEQKNEANENINICREAIADIFRISKNV